MVLVETRLDKTKLEKIHDRAWERKINQCQLHKAKIMAINGGSLVPMQRLKYEINGL